MALFNANLIIKELRKTKELTQEQLAEGISSRSTITMTVFKRCIMFSYALGDCAPLDMTVDYPIRGTTGICLGKSKSLLLRFKEGEEYVRGFDLFLSRRRRPHNPY